MISALTGTLKRVDEDRVQLQAGHILYELLVPAADVPALEGSVGSDITFHTIFYLQGDASGGNIEPRLIGFLRPDDKKFFGLFTTVKGIGPRTALRALTVPVGEIAQAIESRDGRALVKLDGIGKRTAELIIAELAGKVSNFAYPLPIREGSMPARSATRRSPEEEDAIAALLQLGERRMDAEHLVDRARASNAKLTTTDAIVREAIRLRSVRE
ncbi:MAG TPA: Holliday junction branch migration protein RuvA [Tepidisphaeraceae bacterium]|nr:Holliday junction branch migration protein RuvA [Tepidisphaeraceae bacterium]